MRRYGVKESGVLTELEQLRAMSDPLRVNLVRALSEEPMTTTQVARVLKVKPNRLYYHVTELERVGILEVVETRQKGNLVEKYYQPVARLFRIDPCIFQKGQEGRQAYVNAARSNFDSTILDIHGAMEKGVLDSEDMASAHNAYVDFELSEEDSRLIYREFRELMDRWRERSETSGSDRRTHLTLLLYTKRNPEVREDAGEAR